jgi:hypothetical protein
MTMNEIAGLIFVGLFVLVGIILVTDDTSWDRKK